MRWISRSPAPDLEDVEGNFNSAEERQPRFGATVGFVNATTSSSSIVTLHNVESSLAASRPRRKLKQADRDKAKSYDSRPDYSD